MIKLKPTCALTRESVRSLIRIVALLLTLISLLSCISSVTPHENFKSLMAHNVSSSIDSPNVVGSTLSKYLMESKSLPNGNIENKYSGRGTCRTFFEFNPETRIIVGWHYEGTEQDCIIVP